MLPALSQRLLVNQTIPADPMQPKFALIPDGVSGVAVPAGLVGIAVVNCEKLGLISTNHHVNWAPGVLEGEVTIEVADEVNYTGAWTPIRVVNYQTTSSTVQAPKQDVVTIDGTFAAFRHRITGYVAGGSVTTKIVGVA